MRKIAEMPEVAGVEVRTYRDPEWNEFQVRTYIEGKHVPEWDYFTDDKADALNSMKIMQRDVVRIRQAQTAPTTAAESESVA